MGPKGCLGEAVFPMLVHCPSQALTYMKAHFCSPWAPSFILWGILLVFHTGSRGSQGQGPWTLLHRYSELWPRSISIRWRQGLTGAASSMASTLIAVLGKYSDSFAIFGAIAASYFALKVLCTLWSGVKNFLLANPLGLTANLKKMGQWAGKSTTVAVRSTVQWIFNAALLHFSWQCPWLAVISTRIR